MNVTIETIDFGGWPNSLRLRNDRIELVATTDVGPRIIRLGFIGEQNLFKTYDSMLGLTGGGEWRIYGGHRLWHAPEAVPRSYAPDNDPVAHDWNGETLTLSSREPANGLEKSIRVRLWADEPRVHVHHRIVNRNAWAIELAPWALSVMAPGGRAIYPQEEYRPHPDELAPARPLVLWHFADMSDPRWTWSTRYIQLRQEPAASTKQKVGFANSLGWGAYVLGGDVFVKRYPFDPTATYADLGCNTETFTDADMLEVETLGPVTRLEPGGHVDHVEEWLLAKASVGATDDDIDAALLPLVAGMRGYAPNTG